jgi:polar amino acid transport system substrate-binding protein
MSDRIRAEIAPTGTLRVGVNLSNMLLVTDRAEDGTPIGVSPDMAAALADQLNLPYRYKTYPNPGASADGMTAGDVDIVLIANEAERAKTIAFSPAYCEIEGTYLVAGESPIVDIEQVDRPGIRIAVADRAAYDLYLSRTLEHAELVRAQGLPGAVDLFVRERLDVLAGLRPALIENAKSIPGSRLLDGRYITILQSIGTAPDRREAIPFIADFCRDACASGFVAELLERHGVADKLTVAA